MNLRRLHYSSDKTAGFSLVEMVVTASIIAFLSVSLVINFRRTRKNIKKTTNLVVATGRDPQSRAVSSTIYAGYNPCGYGLHYISPTQFAVYVGPNAASVDCSGTNRNYQPGEDTLLVTKSIIDKQMEIKNIFSDIFYEPPDPRTYLNNNSSLNQQPLGIQIGKIGVNCPQNCKTIYVYPSGKIESQ